MKTIYIDSNSKCHVTNDGTMLEVEMPKLFNGKCDAFIEGYRYVPEGEEWMREDGKWFKGEMIAPWKDYAELDSAQREYEREKLADAENALAILLGGESV